nr:type IV toxin-antitoxin system AbiEi family antitoxin domain-containing protein [Propionicimonas sp.]
MDVTRARELRTQGTSPQALDRLTRTGQLRRVRHGAYASELGADDLVRHRQLIAGTWPLLGDLAVLSHATAGVLHGLPLWNGMLDRVSITRPSGGHGRVRTHLRVHVAPLARSEVTEMDGFRVTSLERTAIDLARSLPYERGVAVLDAALHGRADRTAMTAIATQAGRRSGVATARAALAFADGRSESVGESISRIRLCEAGLPAPELQVDIFDEDGNWVARSDVGWVSRGVLGEFDGKVKYRGPQEEVATVVMQEKRREANVRDLGWVMARWGWDVLGDRQTLRHRVEVAFGQARPDKVKGFAKVCDRY